MNFKIIAKKRDAGNATEDRERGLIPAVLYGPEIDAVSISVDPLTFERLYDEAGESTLIDLTIEGRDESSKVLIQDVQYDEIRERFLHIDFRQINMSKEMYATAELTFVGESSAVKTLGGTLIKQQETIDIKCLPKDLVNHIDVDLSLLASFDDSIYIKDLVFPTGVSAVDDGSFLVAKVAVPLSEEELKAMEESQVGDVAAIETEKKKEGVGEAIEEDKKDEKKGDKKEDKKK